MAAILRFMSEEDEDGSLTGLRADGVRVTRQRVAILQVLRDAENGGGVIGMEEAVASVVILKKE